MNGAHSTAAALLGAAILTAGARGLLCGDCDQDGRVTILDAHLAEHPGISGTEVAVGRILAVVAHDDGMRHRKDGHNKQSRDK